MSGGHAPTRTVLLLVALSQLTCPARFEPAAAPVDSEAAPGGETLRFAVSAMLSPSTTFGAYDALLGHVASQLDRPYRMVQRRTYQEINDLLLAGDVDMAFICSGALAAFEPDAPIEILAAPVVRGATTYNSVIIVRTDAPYQRFEDLKGARFAFTDVLSNTGHLYPHYRLHELGTTPKAFFSEVILTGAHDRSILAVYRKLVDAAAVDVLIYDQLIESESAYKPRLRVIETSTAFAIPPAVAPKSVPARLRARLRAILLAMGEAPSEGALLEPLGFDGFASIEPAAYEPIRRMQHALGR